MKHALVHGDVAPEIRERIQGRQVFLCVDFDGTLAPIVLDPERAIPVPGVLNTLQTIARVIPVAVVSGRDLADVRNRVRMRCLFYAGSHGFEVSGPDGFSYCHEPALLARGDLATVARELEGVLASIQGAAVEHKAFAVTVHFRAVPQSLHARIEKIVAGLVAGYPRLRYFSGKMIFEILPDLAWHKGHAVHFLMRELGLSSRIPIFAGDDTTDEDAFGPLRQLGGITIRIGPADAESLAEFAVDSPHDFAVFLARAVDLFVACEGGRYHLSNDMETIA